MLVTATLVAVGSLVLVVPALLLLGHRWRTASRAMSVVLAVAWAVAVGEVVGRCLDLPSRFVVVAEVALVVVAAVVVIARPLWNPVGHVFFASLALASISYLALAAKATVASGLGPFGVAASAVLFLLELFAVVVSATFAFESVDVGCRARWRRPEPLRDARHFPFVSLHVPAYNEPPDMLIETICSLEELDYPHFEIVVIDNNTADEDVWRPVEAYCVGRPRVSFVHVNPWPGYKSGALNLILREHTHPDAEIIGVVDADYLVRPDYLRSLVGYFADKDLAFVQTPQDYREYEGDTYLTACYDAYRYFFETAMPSRNDRNSIIFGGTMGLIRRSVLEDLGGWDEWCITEDAESSLRMLRAGHTGLFVNETFGVGIMPLTFTALKKQRFRWCFGGVQILRKHWRSLMPWDRHPDNHLTVPQRLDYLFGGLQWFGDLVGLAFTLLLLLSASLVLTTGDVALRALTAALLLVPVVLIGSGLIRALWALRVLSRVTWRRALLAFATWLSLSWTTALACARGVVRRDGVFLRTPKWRSGGRLVEALRETRVETMLAAGLLAVGAAVVIDGEHWGLAVLAIWQAAVFACSPYMAWLNQHTELSARLARRARSEDRRDRVAAIAPAATRVGFAGATLAAIALFVLGGTDRSAEQANVFERPEREATDRGPLGNLGVIAPAPTLQAPPSEDPPDVSPPVSVPFPTTTTATPVTTAPTTSPSTTASTSTSTVPPGRGNTTTTVASSSTTSTPGPPASRPTTPTSHTPPSSGPPTSRRGRG